MITAPLTWLRPGWTPVNRYGFAILGGIVLSIALLALRPAPTETAWAVALLMLAPLVLVPLGLRLIAPPTEARAQRLRGAVVLLQLPAALLLGGAFVLPQGPLAAILALPWLATTGLLALLGLRRLWEHRRGSLSALCVGAGLVYISVGGCWAVLDRWGARPLDFEPVIVLLTAIHFHYAGFALPLLTGLAMRHVEGTLSRLAGVGVVVAVPLVAVGITATQANWGPLLECVSACLTALSGILTGSLYFRLAGQPTWPRLIRGLWALASVSLTGSMVLAAAYGIRFYLAISWLDIPWMRAWHGTANALGFGLAGLLGWTLADRKSAPLS